MNDMLAVILLLVLVLGGPVGCAVKALLGIEQNKNLPNKFIGELNED